MLSQYFRSDIKIRLLHVRMRTNKPNFLDSIAICIEEALFPVHCAFRRPRVGGTRAAVYILWKEFSTSLIEGENMSTKAEVDCPVDSVGKALCAGKTNR